MSRSKNTIVSLLVVGLIASIALNVYLYSKIDHNGNVGTCQNATSSYNSIPIEVLKEGSAAYRKSRGNDEATKSVFVPLSELEAYLCAIHQGAEVLGMSTEGLGINMYFVRYEERDNLAFVPANKVGEQTNDWSIADIISPAAVTGRSYIMNRFDTCPVHCGESVVN